MYAVLLAAAFSTVVVAVFVALFWRLFALGRENAPAPDWLEGFSAERYGPMERLLGDSDLTFLAGQPGYHPSMAERLRAARRSAFRRYLKSLRRDFHRLHKAARLLLLHSPVDRPDLAAALIRQKAAFEWAVMAVEVRLVLHAAGFGTVEARGLVDALVAMRAQLGPVAVPAAA